MDWKVKVNMHGKEVYVFDRTFSAYPVQGQVLMDVPNTPETAKTDAIFVITDIDYASHVVTVAPNT